MLAAAGVPAVVGVIQSDVPGTPIQDWSSRATISKCSKNTTITTSHLYNTMIHPMVEGGVAVAAMVWYQGESNVGAAAPMDGADYYGCALPTMVDDWRASFPQPTPATGGRRVPFFVVELAAYCNEHDEGTFRTFCDANTSALTSPDYHLPAMRIAQAKALSLPGTYLDSAMDLGSLHPLPCVNKKKSGPIGTPTMVVGHFNFLISSAHPGACA